MLPLLPFERRGAKLYLPGAVATLGARSDEADALERELAVAGVRATKVEDDELVRFSRRATALCDSVTDMRSARAPTRWRGA